MCCGSCWRARRDFKIQSVDTFLLRAYCPESSESRSNDRPLLPMYELYTIVRDPIPKRLHGIDGGYALRQLSLNEVLAIEDQFFVQGKPRKLSKESKTLIIPEATRDPLRIHEYARLAEFALSLIAKRGHPSVAAVALFNNGSCISVRQLARRSALKPSFPLELTSKGACQWLRQCLRAEKKARERLHITADRYVRYATADHISDGLLDLSISLESLLDTQTEISFKFGACLAKVTGEAGTTASDMAKLLSELYSVRSKLAHGDPSATKLLKKIQPRLPELRRLARKILVTYVLFLSEHTREEWNEHVRDRLFA